MMYQELESSSTKTSITTEDLILKPKELVQYGSRCLTLEENLFFFRQSIDSSGDWANLNLRLQPARNTDGTKFYKNGKRHNWRTKK